MSTRPPKPPLVSPVSLDRFLGQPVSPPALMVKEPASACGLPSVQGLFEPVPVGSVCPSPRPAPPAFPPHGHSCLRCPLTACSSGSARPLLSWGYYSAAGGSEMGSEGRRRRLRPLVQIRAGGDRLGVTDEAHPTSDLPCVTWGNQVLRAQVPRGLEHWCSARRCQGLCSVTPFRLSTWQRQTQSPWQQRSL